MGKVEFTQGILDIQPDLHRFAYKLTADRDSANDLVQDCVLQALDNHDGNGKEPFVFHPQAVERGIERFLLLMQMPD